MIRNAAVTALVLTLAPLSVAAQGAVDTAERMRASETRVAEAGIPAELIKIRIAEGRAKGASEERIALAIERRAAVLLRAQDAMASIGRPLGSAELSAGADALEAGVDARHLHVIIQQARSGEAPVALAVLGQLVRQGLPVEEALKAVGRVIGQGGGALASLPVQVARARARQSRPEQSGRPAGVGGGPPGGVRAPAGAVGPPAGVPVPGKRPGAGKPSGKPSGKLNGPPKGIPAGGR